MPYYRDNNKRVHDLVIVKLGQHLRKENPDHKYHINPKMKSKKKYITLRNGKHYYPDILDETGNVVYEVHWHGGRKEEHFDGLPDGWQAVDVFITHSMASSVIVARMPDFAVAKGEFEKLL